MKPDMWTLVMFDLPVKTKTEKREAVRFRNWLLEVGFIQIQYSVYARYNVIISATRTLLKQLESGLPSYGEIRILFLTDTQWANSIYFKNNKKLALTINPTH